MINYKTAYTFLRREVPFFVKKYRFDIVAVLVCVAAGVLLHFAYEWSGESRFVGFIGAVNESTWEHLKLLFYPVLAVSIIQWAFKEKDNSKFIFARTVSLILGMLFIVTAFYTVSGITGKEDMPIFNIGLFVVSVILVFFLTRYISKALFVVPKILNILSLIVILLFIILFTAWTYNPPSIPFFKE